KCNAAVNESVSIKCIFNNKLFYSKVIITYNLKSILLFDGNGILGTFTLEPVVRFNPVFHNVLPNVFKILVILIEHGLLGPVKFATVMTIVDLYLVLSQVFGLTLFPHLLNFLFEQIPRVLFE